MDIAVLAGLGIGLAFSVFRRGGIDAADWAVTAAVVGATALAWWARRRRPTSPAMDPVCRWALPVLIAMAALQLVPIPVGVLEVLSPLRAEMARFAGEGWVPVTVWPEATRWHVVRLLVYAATFFLARELSLRWAPERFPALVPLMAVAGLEAVLGLTQTYVGGADAVARGTYPNRNHFAGLLELAMPVTVGWAMCALERGKERFASPVRPVLLGCALFGLALAMLAAVLGSLSRAGFLGCLVGLGVTGLMLAVRPGRRWMTVAAAGAVLAGVGAFVFLPSDPLIVRFAEVASTDEISRDTRSQIWADSVRMVRAYAVAGCGLGGFEDAFARFQTVAPMNLVDYAHNDYLQGAAELGVAGLGVVLVLAGRLVAGVIAAVRRQDAGRYAAAACCGAMAALGLHSFTDFNLYIPANGMALAWVGGVAASYLETGWRG